jgi:kinesin family protein 3/17
MEGKDDPPNLRGIIPRSFDHIFNSINGYGDYLTTFSILTIMKSSPGVQFLVRASFLELYNEEIRDLLSKNFRKLEIREKPGSGIFIKDLSSFMI